jgi:uncharacterized membrane protein
MVATLADEANRPTRLVITSNAPTTLFGALVLYAVVCVPLMGLALYFAWHGTWVLMPAASAVSIALAAAFRSGYRRSHLREELSVHGPAIDLDRGHTRIEEHLALARSGAQIEWQDTADETRHLLIRTADQVIEVGSFLDAGERSQLAEALRRLLVDEAAPWPRHA